MSLPPSSAPTATGWSDSCRAGFAPAEEWRLSRRTRSNALARRARAPRRDAGRLPRRAARCRSRPLERLDGGRPGVVPREARRSASPGQQTYGPGARQEPADRRRLRGWAGATVRSVGPRGCARHLLPSAPVRTWGRIREGRPRARTGRCCDRGTAAHGRDAALLGERAPLGRRRRLDRRRRYARHRTPQQDQPGGRRK